MPGLGQSRWFAPPLTTSGLPPTADIMHRDHHFRKVLNRDLNPPVRHVRSTLRSSHSSDRPLCARSCPSEFRDPTSAFTPKADLTRKLWHVGNVPILLQKVFLGQRTKIPRAAETLQAWRREGPYWFTQNQSRTFVAALRSDAAAKKSKDRLSRDF